LSEFKAIRLRALTEILPVQEFSVPQNRSEKYISATAHHAITLIVEEKSLHFQVVIVTVSQLSDVHPQASVTIDIDDKLFRTRKLAPMDAGKPKPIVPIEPDVRKDRGVFIIEVLCSPIWCWRHPYNNRFAPRDPVQAFQE